MSAHNLECIGPGTVSIVCGRRRKKKIKDAILPRIPGCTYSLHVLRTTYIQQWEVTVPVVACPWPILPRGRHARIGTTVVHTGDLKTDAPGNRTSVLTWRQIKPRGRRCSGQPSRGRGELCQVGFAVRDIYYLRLLCTRCNAKVGMATTRPRDGFTLGGRWTAMTISAGWSPLVVGRKQVDWD